MTAPAAVAVAAFTSPAALAPCRNLLGWETGFDTRFALGTELGRGSFGIVHRARDIITGREVAVKQIPKSPASSRGGSPGASAANTCAGARAAATASFDDAPCSPDAREHLDAIAREAAAFASVQGSAFVARLHGTYETSDAALIVQELCTGATIKQLLEAAPSARLPERQAAAIMRGVLDVLCECHARGLIFCDVKPSNYLVAPDGTVRAIDFGCARPAPVSQACGTPLFMAPEFATQRRCGTAVDLWSAGVMLYLMLSGRLPFWSNLTHEEVAALPPWSILAGCRCNEVSFPRAQWAGISPHARALCEALLQRDPRTRPTAAETLAHPWLRAALGYTPQPTGESAAVGATASPDVAPVVLNNVVEFSPGRVAAVLA
jgi:calcium/calmodulin-dependent protein kinase I